MLLRNVRANALGPSWGTCFPKGASPPPPSATGRAPSGNLVFRGAGLRVYGVERAPKSLEASFGRAKHFEVVPFFLILEPGAPGGAMAHVGFLVHAEIGQRARLCDAVETLQPRNLLRCNFRHL